jgi:integrase
VRKRHVSSGFPTVVKRKNGKKVVIWRWYGVGSDGKSHERWKTLGLASRFKSDAAARQEAERLGLGRPLEDGPRIFKELVDHWLEAECPDTDEDPNERRAFSTRDNYRGYLRKWITPRWGDQALEQVKAVAVESWLASLKKENNTALANGSKKKIRDLMHLLYEHAIRYEWTDRNPITSVRQSGLRQSTPIRLNVDQLSQLIFGQLKQRERLMVLLDFGTGLRRGELSGVRWEDICFKDKVLTPKRSIVKQRIGKVKTEASKKSIPLDDVLIEELLAWRRETPYAGDSDYIFASTKMKGKQPYWMSRIMQYHIKPVAAKAGIGIKGWHTLRHSYTTLLRQNNNNPKVVQGLLRHASFSITMNVYDDAMSEEKRNAHRGVIQQLNRSVTRSAPKPAIPQIVDKVGVPDGI